MRISGLPIVVWPIFYAWLNAPRGARTRRNTARLLAALAVAHFAALGASLFFLYCYVRFGYWDLYMRTQFLGWDVRRTTSPSSTAAPTSSAFRSRPRVISSRNGSVASSACFPAGLRGLPRGGASSGPVAAPPDRASKFREQELLKENRRVQEQLSELSSTSTDYEDLVAGKRVSLPFCVPTTRKLKLSIRLSTTRSEY